MEKIVEIDFSVKNDIIILIQKAPIPGMSFTGASMIYIDHPTKKFAVPATNRAAFTLEGFFPGKKVVVDDLFRQMAMVRPTFKGSPRRYHVYSTWKRWPHADTAPPTVTDIEIIARFKVEPWCHAHFDSGVLAVLAYLGGEGWSLLDIPAGDDEVNLILDYVEIEGRGYVAFIEHEIEGGEEEIHLHVRPLNRWGYGDNPFVIVRA